LKFTYYNPVRIHFGAGRVRILSDAVGDRRVLLVADAGFRKLGWDQHIACISNQLAGAVDDIQPNPNVHCIKSVYNKLRHDAFDVIVAVGGGSAIDTAKALSIVDKGERFALVQRLMKPECSDAYALKPVIAVPTTAGTGSEATPPDDYIGL
jgi:alcohol dehydrogenase class IV